MNAKKKNIRALEQWIIFYALSMGYTVDIEIVQGLITWFDINRASILKVILLYKIKARSVCIDVRGGHGCVSNLISSNDYKSCEGFKWRDYG